MSFKLNFKRSPKDTRDYTIKSKINLSSQNVDLSSFCTSIKNQKGIGSCTSHACIALLEFLFKKFKQSTLSDLFSEKFVYYVTRVNIENGKPNDDSGAYIRDTMKCLAKYGSALEKTFPYIKENQSECDFAETPNEAVYEEGRKYQITKYVNISDSNPISCLNDLKNVLNAGYGFVGGFLCFENLFNGENGFIPEPKGEIVGGHAIMFVGYDDEKKVFKFKNSWGEEWGNKGFGYLPYSYILNGLAFDFWTILETENNDNIFGIIKPNNRDYEISRRMNEILRLSETENLENVINMIDTDVTNSNLYGRDIKMLKEFVNRIYRLRQQFESVFEKIKS